MQGTDSTLHFSDYQGQAHKIACSKAVNRATPSKRYVLQLPLSPRLAECLHVMLPAPGSPSATMSSSLHHLQKVLLLLLSSNRYSSRILTSISMCLSSIASFRVIESTTTIMHMLFFKMLGRPILSSHVYRACTQASPHRGCVSQGYPLAMMNGCSSLCRRRQLQSRSTWISLTLYLTVAFTTRCCASARTLDLLFLGVILQHPSYQPSLQKWMP